jgi:hypothetical protein
MADIIRIDPTTLMPAPPPPTIIEFAERLLRHEAEEADTTTGLAAGLQRICHALNVRLSPLISSSGFQALFARALRLATRDFPFLTTVQLSVNGDCTLSGLPGALAGRTPVEGREALTAVLAQFIWLLVIFIGENLGLRKVREVWPEVPFGRNHSSGAEE